MNDLEPIGYMVTAGGVKDNVLYLVGELPFDVPTGLVVDLRNKRFLDFPRGKGRL